MTAAHTSDSEWLTSLLRKCEAIALQTEDDAELLRMHHQLFDEFPSDADEFTLVVAKSLALQTFGRLANRFAQHRYGEICDRVTELGSCAAADLGATWRRASLALLQVAGHTGDHLLRDQRLCRASVIIRTRYSDPALNLAAVARQSGISPWQLSRLMKRHTGHGFTSHVHATRVEAAERLLIETSLSVKEIAATVGYRSTTQMDRQFRRASGAAPSALRSRMIAARSNQQRAIIDD